MNQPNVYGHRGSSKKEPENTMRAFRASFSEGAQGIEFDIRLTADKEIVCIHDATINRTSNGSGKVAEMTLKDLQRFDFGKGEKIPPLKEVLEEFGNKYWLNIEIKETNLEEMIVALLDDLKVKQKIIISSFNLNSLIAFKQLNNQIPTAYIFAFRNQKLEEILANSNINGIHPRKNIVSKKMMKFARENHLAVRPWTIDSKFFTKKMIKYGVNGIITNDPSKILEIIKKNTKKEYKS